MKSSILKLSAFLLVATLLITASACKKDEKCYGKVTVVDTTGSVVGDAVVLLDAPDGQVTYTETTDGYGVAEFEIKLPAIFNITATQESIYPGMKGRGTLRVDEPGKHAEVTVKIQP